MTDSAVDSRSAAGAGLARWSAARATNALRRVRLMSTVGALVGVSVLGVLQILPREADRAVRARVAALPPQIDTASLQWTLQRARDSMRRRQAQLSTLQEQRQQDSMFVVSVTDAAGVPRVVVGDTLRAQLAAQLQLARATPIVEGFMALAASPALASDSLAQLFADSLREAERERGAFAALGGPDLRYRALQERVLALGERLAERAAVRLRDDSLLEQSQETPADTALMVAQRAVRLAMDSVAELETSLRRASEWNTQRAERERELQAAGPVQVPMLPMLLAALIIAAASGYVAAFAVEWRHPRIADATEVTTLVERAGVDATAVFSEFASRDLPRRRSVDRALPAVLRRDTSAYVRVHQQLSTIGDAVTSVGVMSEQAEETAVCAVLLAAAAAESSRAVLLVDADVAQRRVAPALEHADGIGLADVARDRTELASTLITVNTSRDHHITLVPAGRTTTPHAQLLALAPELQRLMQRHDLTVLALSSDANSWPTQLLPRDVVLTVTPGQTPVEWLSSALRAAGNAGQRVRGVLVLHDA